MVQSDELAPTKIPFEELDGFIKSKIELYLTVFKLFSLPEVPTE